MLKRVFEELIWIKAPFPKKKQRDGAAWMLPIKCWGAVLISLAGSAISMIAFEQVIRCLISWKFQFHLMETHFFAITQSDCPIPRHNNNTVYCHESCTIPILFYTKKFEFHPRSACCALCLLVYSHVTVVALTVTFRWWRARFEFDIHISLRNVDISLYMDYLFSLTTMHSSLNGSET